MLRDLQYNATSARLEPEFEGLEPRAEVRCVGIKVPETRDVPTTGLSEVDALSIQCFWRKLFTARCKMIDHFSKK